MRAVMIFGFLLSLLSASAGCQNTATPAAPSIQQPEQSTDFAPTATESTMTYTVDGFQELLAQAEARKPAERQPLVDLYIAHLPSSPLASGEKAIFIWRGDATTVQLIGDMNNWQLDSAPLLERLGGTDLWYLEQTLESNARLDYRYAVDEDDWQLDPLNPSVIASGFGPNSELAMPAYEWPQELQTPVEPIPSGELVSHTILSSLLNQTRTFYVYDPPGQIVGAKTPSIYINDGGDYLNLLEATTLLDRLIAYRQIPPLVAVFIPPLNREAEYIMNDAYVNFLADELAPFIQQNYDTDPSPSRTGTMGSSLGGLGSLYTAITRADVFGLSASQSGAFSFAEDALIERLTADQRAFGIGGPARRDIRIYLVVGTYETAISGDADNGNFLAANRRLVNVLDGLEHEYLYEERPEGHSWGLWRGTFGSALRYLYN